MFKKKPNKQSYDLDIKTLDIRHKTFVNAFKKKNKEIPIIQNDIQKLRDNLSLIKSNPRYDIQEAQRLYNLINSKRYELFNLKYNNNELMYYKKVGNIIIRHLTNKESYIEDIKPSQKTNTNNVMSLLDTIVAKQEPTKKRKVRKRKDEHSFSRENVLEEYGIKICDVGENNTEVDKINYINLVEPSNKLSSCIHVECKSCGIEKLFDNKENYYICPQCNCVEFVYNEGDQLNNNDKGGGPYKRKNHYREIMMQFQSKHSIDIPNIVYYKLYQELEKNNINPKKDKRFDILFLKKLLSKLGFKQFYDHRITIFCKMKDEEPPTFTKNEEDKISSMFKQVEDSFEKNHPKDRDNFINYNYVIFKICELLELDHVLPYFTLLKSPDKLQEQDNMWKVICNDLRWEFYPTRMKYNKLF